MCDLQPRRRHRLHPAECVAVENGGEGAEKNNAHVKIIWAALVVILVVICGCNFNASLIDDLASPSPETRTTAAKILRVTYKPPPKEKWDSLLAALKVGDSKTNIEAILFARGVQPGHGNGYATLIMEYRLDEAWLLNCEYLYQGQYRGHEILQDRKIFFSPKWIFVKPPTNFSGIWVMYYINGQKCLEEGLKDGVLNGDYTCYHHDGSKVYGEHYNPTNTEIGWAEYYHSGSVKTKGKRNQNHMPIGVWTNYNEKDGSVLSTNTWPKP